MALNQKDWNKLMDYLGEQPDDSYLLTRNTFDVDTWERKKKLEKSRPDLKPIKEMLDREYGEDVEYENYKRNGLKGHSFLDTFLWIGGYVLFVVVLVTCDKAGLF
jgi:hypothetical protein